jgi:hypothetical protein
MKINKATAGLVGLITSACDPISGVQTNAELATAVDLQCVDKTVRTLPGVGVVVRSTDRSESFQVMPYRGKVTTISEAWHYGGDLGGTVQIVREGKVTTYFNGKLKMGPPFPKAELDAFVPLMKRVNRALERECGLPLRASSTFTRD